MHSGTCMRFPNDGKGLFTMTHKNIIYHGKNHTTLSTFTANKYIYVSGLNQI